MAQIPKGRWVTGPYQPICRDCAIYIFNYTVKLTKSPTWLEHQILTGCSIFGLPIYSHKLLAGFESLHHPNMINLSYVSLRLLEFPWHKCRQLYTSPMDPMGSLKNGCLPTTPPNATPPHQGRRVYRLTDVLQDATTLQNADQSKDSEDTNALSQAQGTDPWAQWVTVGWLKSGKLTSWVLNQK